MSSEEKKEYLRSYRKAKKEAWALEEAIEELRSNRISPSVRRPDGMPKGNGIGDLSAYAARLDELERELQARKWEAIDRYHRVCSDILAVPDETERRLLQYRYINGYTWEQIAVKMGYSWRQTHYIHRRALEHFEVSTEMSVKEKDYFL